jgi:hypothetical protein
MTGGPETNLDAAERFLRWAHPSGPWVLTAIPVEGGRTTTETFFDMGAARGWIEQHSGKQNVYWTVNRVRGAIDKKPKKEDIEEAVMLHVDLDPRKPRDGMSAEELAKWTGEEQARILKTLEEFSPSPSAVVYSGGGYQGFWKLDASLYVGGDANRISDLEAYNRQLGIVLQGDNTWNIDRIMRLPGTINIPDEKKRKKGRVKALAAVVELSEATHPLSDFTPAPEVQATNSGSGVKVQISGNLPRLKDLDELPEEVTQRTRMLIVQGDDPDDPTRYSSKSEVMWAVCCELVRAGCEDDIIAAVLLDPDFGVSDHPLRQKRSMEYVARQIERAREEVIEPMLRKLNASHAVIADLGGKCRVISEVLDQNLARPRTRISKQSFEDFRNRYMHIKVQVGQTKEGAPVYESAGKWWLYHPLRRQYDTLVFAPGRDVPSAYNLWKGFACEAIPGDQHQPFLDHLRENVCSGVEEHYWYLINWMARAVQNPGEPGQVAVVLRGGRGAGKGSVAQIFGSLWGRHFLHISSAKHLVGQFNAHLRDCVVLFADEAFFAGDKQHESVLKTLVTEDMIIVEGKGVDAEPSPNFVHLLMASNDHWVVPAGADERRYYILDVGEEKKQDTAYFRALYRSMDEGGREALLHYLMTLDLSNFEVRTVPNTEALQEQKLLSLSGEEQWWLERLMDGRTSAGAREWQESVQKEHLQRDYLRYAEDQRLFRRVSPTVLGRLLGRYLPPGWPKSVQRVTELERDDGRGGSTWEKARCYWYDLPALDVCRAAWDKKFGGKTMWPMVDGDEEPMPERPRRDEDGPY